MKKNLLIFFFIILLIITGFIRESFFKSCNALIDYKHSGVLSYQFNTAWDFLNVFTASSLIKIKWIATFFFAIVFLLNTLVLASLIFETKKYLWIIILSFAGIIFISFSATIIGMIFSSCTNSTYLFSRWLMGIIQSPLFTGIILLLLYYLEKVANKKVE